MLLVCIATAPKGPTTHHLVRANSGPEAHQRLRPLLTPGSRIDTMALGFWIDAQRPGTLPQDVRALDPLAPDERAELEAAGAGLHLVHLNEYLTNRAYGGPEEGGWWFDTGTFVACRGTFPTIPEARDAREALAPHLEQRREGLTPPGDTGCTGWPELVIEEHAGADYPATRPRFE